MMANAKAAKQSFLPPRSPFPTVSPSYIDHGLIGSKPGAKPREMQRHHHHQRTSSESFLIEEQPSWLEDLLNEPETPMRRGGHRRSSSDSFPLFDDNGGYARFDALTLEEYGNVSGHGQQGVRGVNGMPWGANAQEYYAQQSRGWDMQLNPVGYRQGGGGMPMAKERMAVNSGLQGVMKDHHDGVIPNGLEKRNQEEPGQDPKGGAERKDGAHAKQPQFEVDTKRAKQQYAQRSRVRKLQYIAELEKKVHALQAEGMEASAEMEFLGQQNIMLDLENKTLKQRLESLAQEQLIKRFQQEMFEREIGRLQSLFQQQQQQQIQQQQAPTHGRSNSRDLDLQFANLSLKHKDPNSGRDPVSGPLHI